MRRIILFRLGSRDVHLPKLFGAFIMLAATLMLMQSLTGMFDSWENVKAIHACVDAANSNTISFEACQDQAETAFGILLRPNQFRMTDLQVAFGLLGKVAAVFFWVAALIVGMVFYRSGKLTLPIEENTIEMKSRRFSPRTKK